jgi:hypothetical protein
MRRLRNVGLILTIGLCLLALTTAVSAEIKLTTTLLPATAVSNPQGPDKMLVISASGTDPIESTSSVQLSFDLSDIPRSAAVTNATLRLVGRYAKENPQFVRIFTDPQKDSIGTWTATVGKSIFSASTEKLRQAVAEKIKAAQTLSLTLSSKSRLSDWRYYSKENFADTSSYKPRLIIEYKLDRQAAPTTERTSWKFFLDPAPAQFKIKPFLANATILSNPVFYDENIYLFAKPTSESTSLYALFFNGAENWKKNIGVTPAAHALAGGNGILYSVGENRIVLYDLKQEGLPIRSVAIDDFKLSVSPTLGADGSLYFVWYGYIYGLNPSQEELWRFPSGPDDGKAEKASRIVLGSGAQKFAYALVRINKKNQLAAINTADGDVDIYGFSEKYSDFHRPVVVAGPEQDYIFFSAYSVSDGILASYSGGEQIWQKLGPVSQPIADMEGKLLFLIQNGRFQAYDKFNGMAVCTSARADLAATSNLVMDGEENVYFWNNGTFLGYGKDCKPFFEQKLPDLPERLELLFAPDGTLFARSEAQRLALILPTRPAFTLAQDKLRSDTIYSAEAIQTAENLNLDSTANIILKAKDSISFGTGFTAKKGARLSCKVGF